MHFDDAMTRFETQLRADGRAARTVESYLRDVRVLAAWLDEGDRATDVTQIAPEDLADFASSRAMTHKAGGGRKKASSIDKAKMSLKAFFSFLVDDGTLAASPARLLRARRRVDRVPPDILSFEEKRLLLRTVRETRGDKARRDLVILEVLLDTGIRLESLVALDLDDVRLSDRRLVIRRLKGGGESRKLLRKSLRDRLDGYLRWRRRQAADCQALFVSNRGSRLSARQVQRIVEGWVAKAGITKKISPHKLRHSFAAHLHERTGGNLRAVQRALDHRSVTTTEIYAQVSDASLEAALEQL